MAETKLNREQAEEFFKSLYPDGYHSHLHNPTLTFLSALVGRVPSGLAYSANDPSLGKLRSVARILREVADHIEVSHEEAAKIEREARTHAE